MTSAASRSPPSGRPLPLRSLPLRKAAPLAEALPGSGLGALSYHRVGDAVRPCGGEGGRRPDTRRRGPAPA
jgi:hypothetical protein